MNKSIGTTKLVRAKFGPGMLLQHQDLELLNSYTQNLSRLMFRSLFGCGVVCGLDVKVEMKCGKLFVKVNSGVAIACSGDPIWVPETTEFALSDNCDTGFTDPLWVVLCRTVKCCGPRTSVCDDDEISSICTREVDGYEIRVETSRDCFCGCPGVDPKTGLAKQIEDKDRKSCYDGHYDGTCGCSCGECSDCDCDCILLARLTKIDEEWKPDHSVRRFVRPVLMPDPTAKKEQDAEQKKYSNLKAEKDETKRAAEEREKLLNAVKTAEIKLGTATREKDQMKKELDALRETNKKKAEKEDGPKPPTTTGEKK